MILKNKKKQPYYSTK